MSALRRRGERSLRTRGGQFFAKQFRQARNRPASRAALAHRGDYVTALKPDGLTIGPSRRRLFASCSAERSSVRLEKFTGSPGRGKTNEFFPALGSAVQNAARFTQGRRRAALRSLRSRQHRILHSEIVGRSFRREDQHGYGLSRSRGCRSCGRKE